MKKVELLAPAGSMEALMAAVQNGCDAIYLGGSVFGARAFASNFDKEEMVEAVAYAHTYGVRVYVTVNTLIYENEIPQVIAYIKELQDADVDALIIQDLGLFQLLHQRFPDLELHVSTQMHIHNPQGIKMLQEMGAARVVVPRETTIEEVAAYAALGVDLEVFVQGALCVSYSGQCLMSSLTLNRSGNRGACAQPCRMQYTLEENHHGLHKEIKTKGDYLLSPKDLNTLAQVPSLIDAGVASFKIEGRMKRPEYVALMTRLYRQAIDAHLAKKEFRVDQKMMHEMEKVFNRGFTSGHLYHQVGSALMNPLRPNHMGIRAGIIEQVTKDKMTVKLIEDLHQGDGVRILKDKEDEGFRVNRIYQNGLLVNGAKKGERIQLDKTGFVKKGSVLLKTSDTKQLLDLHQTFTIRNRSVHAKAIFTMRIDHHPTLTLMDDDGNKVIIESECITQKALKTPLSKERIEAQLAKSKDTPFDLVDIDLSAVCEDGIMPIKEVNRMRREGLEALQKKRQLRNGKRRFLEEEASPLELAPKQMVMIVVHTLAQYEACKQYGYTHIFVADEALYRRLKQQGEVVYLREERVKKDAYQEAEALIQENAGMANKTMVFGDTSLNITNSYSAYQAFRSNVSIVSLSLEHSYESCKEVVENFMRRYQVKGNFAKQIYGHVELMISEYCPIQANLKDDGKKNCGLCRGNTQYDLKDRKGHRYPIMTDMKCRMHLLSEEPIDEICAFSEYQAIGIQSPLVIFTIEDAHQCKSVLEKLKENVYVS